MAVIPNHVDLTALAKLSPGARALRVAEIVAARNPGLAPESVLFGRLSRSLDTVITSHKPPRRQHANRPH